MQNKCTSTAPAGAPEGVVIEVQGATSVVIKWEPPELTLRNGIIIRYNLIVTFVSNSTVQRYSVPDNVLSISVKGMFLTLILHS